MTAREIPTVAELMALNRVICDHCDGTGWTEGGPDVFLGHVCTKCAGDGMVDPPGPDPVRLAHWDAVTGALDQA